MSPFFRVPDATSKAQDSLPLPAIKRFGTFEVDLRSEEIRKCGLKIKLQGQPVQVLITLLEHPAEVVTREQLRQRLWPADTFVDFEHNLNSAVKRLREVLGDSADNPRFIETLPRHGYRFVAPIVDSPQAVQAVQAVQPVRRSWALPGAVLGALLLITATVVSVGLRHTPKSQPARLAPIHALAVLPFENVSSSSSEEYFADGMTEKLITELAKVRGLHLISRQSVMRYKGTNKTLPQIANELDVEAVVQGSVLRQGNRVRLTAHIVRASPEEHLWAGSYESDERDIISLQERLAREIVSQIRLTTTPQHSADTRPRDANAYMLYLQAGYFQQRISKQNLAKAVDYYGKAIKLDPEFAPAWAGLADAQTTQVLRGYVATADGLATARKSTERALALNPELSEAHVALARINTELEWDWTAAEASIKRALAISPGDPAVLDIAGELACILGRSEESLSLARRIVELDPLNPSAFRRYGLAAYHAGHWEEAASAEEKALELNPDDGIARGILTEIHLFLSKPGEVLEEIRGDRGVGRFQMQAVAYFSLGQKRESDAALRRLIAEGQNGLAYQIAEVYAFRGEADEAFRWLEEAYRQRDSGLLLIKTDPFLKSLKSDPRYAAFLQAKMHLPA